MSTILTFYFIDPAAPYLYTLSLHDALPICFPAAFPGLAGAARKPCGCRCRSTAAIACAATVCARWRDKRPAILDRKSTRLNSSHSQISYAVFCLKKKKEMQHAIRSE